MLQDIYDIHTYIILLVILNNDHAILTNYLIGPSRMVIVVRMVSPLIMIRIMVQPCIIASLMLYSHRYHHASFVSSPAAVAAAAVDDDDDDDDDAEWRTRWNNASGGMAASCRDLFGFVRWCHQTTTRWPIASYSTTISPHHLLIIIHRISLISRVLSSTWRYRYV